jgi:hypothetical protein
MSGKRDILTLMPRARNRAGVPGIVSVGTATHLGWATVVAIAPTPDLFRVIRTDRLAFADECDPEAVEPYHRAAGFIGTTRGALPANPAAILERGLAAQRRLVSAAVDRLARELRAAGRTIGAAAILTGRGRLAASLDKILASHAQIHVAEGLAVRAAFRGAYERLGIRAAAVEQQTAFERASAALRLDERALAVRLKTLVPEVAGQWRQEEKLAALAARLAELGVEPR